MKKHVEVIHADAPLLEWASRTLQEAPEKISGASDLIGGMSELLADADASLLIEQGDFSDFSQMHRTITCGDLTIYIAARKVTRSGTEIYLTPKEFDILLFLAQNRGEVFTKEQIYQAVWEDAYLLDDSNIMAFIRKIRKKIEPNPDAPQYILTIWGIGYKFCDA